MLSNDELRAARCDPEPVGEGERILPAAIVTMVMTEGSTVPIRVTHAGIVRAMRYRFTIT